MWLLLEKCSNSGKQKNRNHKSLSYIFQRSLLLVYNNFVQANFVQYWLDKDRESPSHSKLTDSNQETMKKINSINSDFEFQVKEDRICAQQKPTAYVKKFKTVLLQYIISVLCTFMKHCAFWTTTLLHILFAFNTHAHYNLNLFVNQFGLRLIRG